MPTKAEIEAMVKALIPDDPPCPRVEVEVGDETPHLVGREVWLVLGSQRELIGALSDSLEDYQESRTGNLPAMVEAAAKKLVGRQGGAGDIWRYRLILFLFFASYFIMLGCGLVSLGVHFVYVQEWWGGDWPWLFVLFPPLYLVFPIVMLVKEGFVWWYWLLWVGGYAGMFGGGLLMDSLRGR